MILFVLAVGPSSPASAASPTSGRFTQQAEAAGLSRAGAASLQARVDAYLQELDGVQVAANEIRLADGTATLTLTLPGEKRARSLTSAICPWGSTCYCPYEWFCAWQSTNYSGDKLRAYYCNSDLRIPWGGYGSYKNNQTTGTVARFKNWSHIEIHTSKAYNEHSSYYWGPVYYVDIC